MAGRKIVELIEKNIRPKEIFTSESLENAMMVHSAIGGSTNAVVHIPAIAAELGLTIPLGKWNDVSSKAPYLVNTTAGSEYTIEDFGLAGGIQAVMLQMQSLLNLDVLTCTGSTLRENLKSAKIKDANIIRSLGNPIYAKGAIAILTGNLAPNGAVVKQTAIASKMLIHRGPAKVYDSEDEAKESLLAKGIQPGDVVIIRYEGPKGGPGMREMYTFQSILCGMGLDNSSCAGDRWTFLRLEQRTGYRPCVAGSR